MPAETPPPDLESSSPAYARRFEGPVGRWFVRVQAEATRRLLGDVRPAATVLDVGGGHGQLVPLLVELGLEMTVVGSGPADGTMVESSVARGSCSYRRAPPADLPFPDASFDLVLCYRILPHTDRWEELLAELCRVARGAVVVEFPSARSVNGFAELFFGVKKRIEGNTRRFTTFRPAHVREVLREHGFRYRGHRAQYLFPMALHRWHGTARLGRLIEAVPAAVGLTQWLGSPVILRADRID